FQSLLRQADALDAVSTISGFWSHRADEARPMFGLSLPEYQCQLVLIYTGEVGNGGHVQFFSNRGQKYLDDHLAALEATSLHAFVGTLSRALNMQDDIEGLHLLDQEVWEHSFAVDGALQDFLRKNSNIVLKPERC
uniref:DMP19 family protein n=1 Tax=Yoonia sp. R2-816 TaxID=3342638 RepID=UPI003727FCBD